MSGSLLAFPLFVLLWVAVVVAGIWLIFKVLSGIGWFLGRVFGGIGAVFVRLGVFLRDEVSDVLRVVGGAVTALVFTPLVTISVIAGRWSAAQHYGSAMEREMVGIARSLYRIALGNPARLFGLTGLTDGIERRIPDAIARAPGPDRPGAATGRFDGYEVVGSLPGGGSGARLWLAKPTAEKREQLERAGHVVPGKLVIKSFALAEGSTLPQIVRESRALEAARQLGLVIEHELTAQRFHYVMPYVPGPDLAEETRRLHDRTGERGLEGRPLTAALGHVAELLRILHRFHAHGLWHKDVKPSNVIVAKDGVHLVDLGLLTPLRSAMTLTTHGTEYFRDPELVRLAMRGVKVHEVDGVKFDVYSAGAVLFSLLENSFPAHGSLSQITKPCPDALRFVVRRAMADIDKRYASAAEMLADVEALAAARDPSAFKVADLPSVAAAARGAGAGWIEDLERSLDAAGDDVAAAVDETLGSVGDQGGFVYAAGTGLGKDGGFGHAFRTAAGHAARHARGRHGPASERPHQRARGLVAVLGVLAALVVVAGMGASFLFVTGRPAPTASLVDGRGDLSAASFATAAETPALRLSGGGRPGSGALVPVSQGAASRGAAPAAGDAAPGTTPSFPLPAGDARRVVVLDDLAASAPEAVRAKVASVVTLLERAGFEVLLERRDAEGEERLALFASARKAVGLTSPDDPEASRRLVAWLADEGRGVAVIAWFGTAAGGDHHPFRIEAVEAALQQQLYRLVRDVNARL